MNTGSSIDIAEIAERLAAANPLEDGFADLFRALLRELAKGKPVSREVLAGALGWPAEKVAAALDRAPSTEYDGDGNIVGYGLTLRETPHIFEIDGRRLYTWCALDSLMFPALIGKTAQVHSRCAATGTPVRLTVTPDGVQNMEPAGAMVSLVPADASPDIRPSFCCHVHFFASAPAAENYAATHGNVTIVSVSNALRLAQELVQRLSGRPGASCEMPHAASPGAAGSRAS